MQNRRFPRLSFRRCAEKREADFGMVDRMGWLADGLRMSGVVGGSIDGRVVRRIFTLKVGRKDGMERPAVHMAAVPMAMVDVRVSVDERDREHPHRQPSQCRGAQPHRL